MGFLGVFKKFVFRHAVVGQSLRCPDQSGDMIPPLWVKDRKALTEISDMADNCPEMPAESIGKSVQFVKLPLLYVKEPASYLPN